MKGDARATKEASPTPTSMRHRMRLQNPIAIPHPAVDIVQMPRPTAISRKAFTCLLASAKIGEDTSRPTCGPSPHFSPLALRARLLPSFSQLVSANAGYYHTLLWRHMKWASRKREAGMQGFTLTDTDSAAVAQT